MKTVLLLLLYVLVVSSTASMVQRAKDLELAEKKFQVVKLLLKYFGGYGAAPSKPGEDIKLLTWNVLSPIRIDTSYLQGVGTDVEILRTLNRMRAIAERTSVMLPDIAHFQELQNDTYATLKEYLKDLYGATPFAPHGPSHWLDLPPGMANLPNGGAIFYRKDKFALQSAEAFEIWDGGNVAQAAVFKRVNRGKYPTNPLIEAPILTVNNHFQHGFEQSDSFLRVSQGAAVHLKVQEIVAKLKADHPHKEPIVLVAGDFNSLSPFPGIETFRARGYTNARDATNNTENSIYYPEPIISEFFPVPLEGLPIDTVFVPTKLISDEKVEINSVEIPDIMADSESESGYVTRVLEDLLDDRKQKKITDQTTSAILDSVQNILKDGNAYDTKYNRAIRIGSDHLPVLATIRVLKPY